MNSEHRVDLTVNDKPAHRPRPKVGLGSYIFALESPQLERRGVTTVKVLAIEHSKDPSRTRLRVQGISGGQSCRKIWSISAEHCDADVGVLLARLRDAPGQPRDCFS